MAFVQVLDHLSRNSTYGQNELKMWSFLTNIPKLAIVLHGEQLDTRRLSVQPALQEENVDYPDGGMLGTSERHLWHDDSSHLDFCEEFFRVLLGNHCHLSFACRDISMLCQLLLCHFQLLLCSSHFNVIYLTLN